MLSATAIIGIINLVLIVLMAIINHLNHTKLVGNDLCHLSNDVKAIATKQSDIQKEVGDLKVDLAFVKGNCELHTSKTYRKSKKNLNKKIGE